MRRLEKEDAAALVGGQYVHLGDLERVAQPGGRGGVPVAVMGVGGIEPGQEPGMRGGELRLDLAQRGQRLPAPGSVQPVR